jgi:hypothetical protein
VRNVVTDTQIAYLVGQFDNVMYPRESTVFSVPVPHDGTAGAVLADALGLPTDYYAGDGAKIVTLVSNVRDDNYYDTNNANKLTYIAGFFSTQVNTFLDRNVMTIDAFDWLHRTGANPPDNPSSDPCTNAPARPLDYEGTFAHEYQHLLESYEDPDETNWINEGLSDWAQTLTGYVTPGLPITDKGFDGHIQCFTGFLTVLTPVNPIPRPACGPENSLTRWEDQGPSEILADYGAAYSFMELLAGRYGTSFMTALHRGDANGFAGVDEALVTLHGGSRIRRGEYRDGRFQKTSSQSIFTDWTLAMAVDGLLDQGARIEGRVRERNLQIPTLHSTILWSNPEAYSSPGAPSNGSDYVQLRNAQGGVLRGSDVDSLSFVGSTTLPTQPLQWIVVSDPPGRPGNPALYSGTGDDRDEAAIRSISIPASGGNLTFTALWDLELGWDYAYVQISTDGGTTYTSLSCTAPSADDGTTTDHDPGAVDAVVSQLPGFNGVSGVVGLGAGSAAWVPITCSLGAYAGKTVLLSFRTINDPATQGNGYLDAPGFYVDDVAVAGTVVSDGSSLAGYQSMSEVKPGTVAGFTVHIISIDSARKRISVVELPLTRTFTLRGRANVERYVDRRADFVGAIVTYNDPSETSTQYARYQLAANGVLQPGGA